MPVDASLRAAHLLRYRQGPALLRRAWEAAPSEARTWRPDEGRRSAHEVAVHCADSETYAATLDRLPEEAWGRRGRHTQSGPCDTDDWLRSYAERLEVHAAQIGRNLHAWRGAHGR